MKKSLLKYTILFSLVFGAILGFVSLIPLFIGLCLFILMFFSSIPILLYFKFKKIYLESLTINEGAILGCACGFFATCGFSLIFLFCVFIIKLFLKEYYSLLVFNSAPLWLYLILIFMMALTIAATNSIGAMALAWICSYIEPKKNENNLQDEIKEQ